MKIDNLSRILLTIIAMALSVIALRPFISAPVVSAQSSGARFGYLIPEMGTSHQDGGKNFTDMRNGNLIDCYKGSCKVVDHYALDQIK